MGERKVLNRYIPPDFDPSIIPKFKRDRNRLIEVRMMLPFSLRCNTCGEYMYRGKKFNSKKEDIKDETYLGIKKIRFYIKCTHCNAEITFKTDPQNADYECESGASRNYELWRENKAIVEEATLAKQEEEEMDAMKALENRTMDNQQELDILDALDEIKAINSRHQRVDTNKILETLDRKREGGNGEEGGEEEGKEKRPVVGKDGLTKEDEELLKTIKFKNQKNATNNSGVTNSTTSLLAKQLANNPTTANTSSTSSSSSSSSLPPQNPALPVFTRKRKVEATPSLTTNQNNSGNIPEKQDNTTQKQEDEDEQRALKQAKRIPNTAEEKEEQTKNSKTNEKEEKKEGKERNSEETLKPVSSSTSSAGAVSLLMGYGDDDNEEE